LYALLIPLLQSRHEFGYLEDKDLDTFECRKKLKPLEDAILNLPLMLKSIRGTLQKLTSSFKPGAGEALDVFSFDELLEETNLLLARVETLEKRIKRASTITSDLSVHHNSTSMKRLAEDTKNDSAAMKIITIITVFFLPATFVAVGFPFRD
jgi:Mg2+ and Co2+ transporter CorA